ncbi:MAG: elongation factor 1-beta [Candidatus Aenigmatarchaeota archaeon]|nr:MAG: elongation factor 1-beta [Candidatus Aenigmarchaeota archaeon]
MGEVICVFRILPKSPEMFDQVKEALEKLDPNRIEEEPIAFGLKAIKFTKIIPDVGGAQDKLENQIRSTEGVDNIETLKISRCL